MGRGRIAPQDHVVGNSPRRGEFPTTLWAYSQDASSIFDVMERMRNLRHAVDIALKDTPVVLVNGARQTGKTTLVKAASKVKGSTYVTLDDHGTLQAALNDPPGFIQGLGRYAVIDE